MLHCMLASSLGPLPPTHHLRIMMLLQPYPWFEWECFYIATCIGTNNDDQSCASTIISHVHGYETAPRRKLFQDGGDKIKELDWDRQNLPT